MKKSELQREYDILQERYEEACMQVSYLLEDFQKEQMENIMLREKVKQLKEALGTT